MNKSTVMPARADKPIGLMRYSEEQVGKAILDAGGIIKIAAASLKCERATVYEYTKRYPALMEVVHKAREATIDTVESQLLKACRNGNVNAIIFFLKTQAKSRGYVERSELDMNPNGEPIRFTFKINERAPDDDSRITIDMKPIEARDEEPIDSGE